MAHLGQIQQLLNNDKDYRGRFLKDPVAALAEQGLILPFDMQAQIRQMVTQAQTGGSHVPGSAVLPGGWSPTTIKPWEPAPGLESRIRMIFVFE